MNGAVVIAADGDAAELGALSVIRADQGVEVSLGEGGPRVDSVEHLLAALAGLSIRSGVRVDVAGGEVPLLDGGATAFCGALACLGVGAEEPSLAVLRDGTVRVGASEYAFSPGESSRVDVEIAFDAPGIGVQRVTWDGSPTSFERDVAWARTFGFRRDGAALQGRGRARGVNPDAVMILGEDGRAEPPSAPARPNEHALHKLLDLVGDAALFGGPPRGVVRAIRPGHQATHHAFRTALAEGILVTR
jgi:UDP-3-O-[3-hydroxymyristoyl] N-acetylglucosamine deacetylase